MFCSICFFFFKQKTAYEMRISDWSSDVCSSDLPKTAEEYIGSYIQDRFSFHWSKHEPSGPGTGGTIVGVLTGGDVIADLEGLIVDTVTALLGYNDDFDLDQWRKEWEGKASDA